MKTYKIKTQSFTFRLKRQRQSIPIHDSPPPLTRSNLTYKIAFSYPKTRSLYDLLLSSIGPNDKILLIFGLKKNKKTLLKIYRSDSHLTSHFKSQIPLGFISQLDWIIKTLNEKKYETLLFEFGN